ncbi:MAG: hypothetical protein ACLTSC_00750 [Mediterraneibacter faecis]
MAKISNVFAKEEVKKTTHPKRIHKMDSLYETCEKRKTILRCER